MSRRTRKRIEWVGDWELPASIVNGWFWPDVLKHRARKARGWHPRAARGPRKRLRWKVGARHYKENELPF